MVVIFIYYDIIKPIHFCDLYNLMLIIKFQTLLTISPCVIGVYLENVLGDIFERNSFGRRKRF